MTRATRIEATAKARPPSARGATPNKPDEQRERGLQRHHEPDARPAVREVRPDEADDIGQRRRATHECHREIHDPRIRRIREGLLDQHRRGRALDQAQREAQQRPGSDLAAKCRFGGQRLRGAGAAA